MRPTIDDFARRIRPLAAALAVVAGLALAPASAAAEKLHLPRIGQQFLSAGLTLQPGFLYDRTTPSTSDFSAVTAAGAGTIRLGFHQILSEGFIMSAEADLGAQWFNEHTAETRGRADSELAFAWQLGLMGRWLPFGLESGWEVGLGPQLYTVHLSDRPLMSLGVGLRAGHYIWRGSEHYALVEFGYSAPFIQGLRNRDFVSEDGGRAPEDWTFHRFMLSIQYGF